MSDETEEQKKLMRQIDISCVQAFHTMDEIDARFLNLRAASPIACSLLKLVLL